MKLLDKIKTPQEKAKELIEKFTEPTKVTNVKNVWVEDMDAAKQCALICVQEIIYAITYGIEYEWIQFRNKQTDYIVYWNEVKQEIEKL